MAIVLVDTSLLIEQLKRPKLAAPVKQALSGFRVQATSSYAKLQFKRAWIQRLCFAYNECIREDVTSIADLLARFAKLIQNPFQKRRAQTCIEFVSKFLDLDKSIQVSDRARLQRMASFLKNSALSATQAFEELCAIEFKGTGCVRAEIRPTVAKNNELLIRIPKCSPRKIECRVHNFFDENTSEFSEIASRIDGAPNPSDELQEFKTLIESSKYDSKCLCDSRNCGALGDAIIAVDGKATDTFAANNDREWRLLATALKKDLLNPVTGVTFRCDEKTRPTGEAGLGSRTLGTES